MTPWVHSANVCKPNQGELIIATINGLASGTLKTQAATRGSNHQHGAKIKAGRIPKLTGVNRGKP